MENEKVRELDAPNFEEIFDVQADDVAISRVRAFEPELRNREIVLPVEFTKTDGTSIILGFTLDKEHLRDLFEAFNFAEVIDE
jgi:hypothetical protein